MQGWYLSVVIAGLIPAPHLPERRMDAWTAGAFTRVFNALWHDGAESGEI
jgi:hypothetical protein